jgi:hypothetical protein
VNGGKAMCVKKITELSGGLTQISVGTGSLSTHSLFRSGIGIYEKHNGVFMYDKLAK